MNRNTRTLIVMAVAVLMASLASFGVYLAVQSMPVREVEVARAQAVVAARPLPSGLMLTKDDVKVVPWPAASQVPGAFTEIERVVNRGVLVAVSENEPLTEAKLAAVGAGRRPAAQHPRRHARRVDSRERSGRRRRLRRPRHARRRAGARAHRRIPQPQTRVVLSNVQVLTAGTRYDQDAATARGQADPDQRRHPAC